MIGVALFGIFLTPVFFFVLMWFGRHKQAGAELVSPAAGSAADAAGTLRIPAEAVRPPPKSVGSEENRPPGNTPSPAGTDHRDGTK
jgi:hypothetical protein